MRAGCAKSTALLFLFCCFLRVCRQRGASTTPKGRFSCLKVSVLLLSFVHVHAGSELLALDLKGLVFSTTVLPLAGTAMVVNIGGTEAKACVCVCDCVCVCVLGWRGYYGASLTLQQPPPPAHACTPQLLVVRACARARAHTQTNKQTNYTVPPSIPAPLGGVHHERFYPPHGAAGDVGG